MSSALPTVPGGGNKPNDIACEPTSIQLFSKIAARRFGSQQLLRMIIPLEGVAQLEASLKTRAKQSPKQRPMT